MLKERPDGIILDVDGTLWNSTPLVAGAWNRAAIESGIKDSAITDKILQREFGKTMSVIAADLFPEVSVEKQTQIMDLCCVYEHQTLEEDECAICYPGVIDTIKKLSEKLPVFIVSNCQSGYIELFMKKTKVEAFITDHECFGDTGKNKDENIRMVVERNHLRHPVYVGDTQGDCDAAYKAGTAFIFANYGFGQADRMDAEISQFDQLLTLILESEV